MLKLLLKDNEETADIPFCLLNELFDINFLYYDEILPQNKIIRENMVCELLLLILKKMMELHPIMIAVDDAHNMDDASWKILYNAARAYHHIICIITIDQIIPHSNYINKVLHSKNTTILMTSVEASYIGILACQILNVIGIHKDIVNAQLVEWWTVVVIDIHSTDQKRLNSILIC